MCASLAVRRLAPALALAGVWAAALLQMATLIPATGVDVAVLGVAYATAAYGGRTVRMLGLASAVGGGILSAAYLTFSSRDGYFNPVFSATHTLLSLVVLTIGMITLFGLSWTLGLLVRTVRQSREAKVQAAAAAQRAAYESAIEQERTRIARDMHDVVAHSLAVVIAQADGARYTGSPEVQTDALGTIPGLRQVGPAQERLGVTSFVVDDVEAGDIGSALDRDGIAVRPGDIVHTEITYAAPHHLVADGAARSYRSTRAGDLWEAGQRTSGPVVSLGLPTVGVPASR